MPTVRTVLRLIVLMSLGLLLAIAPVGLWEPLQSPEVLATPQSASERVTDLEQQWRQDYLAYFERDLAPPILTPDQIDASLQILGDSAQLSLALIYILPNEDNLEIVLAVPGQSLIHEQLPVPLSQLQSTVADLQEQVSLPRISNRYLAPAQQLYEWLIAPISQPLQDWQIESLMFCVGTPLRSLPFAALHDGDQFLVESYSIGIIPAFSLADSQPATDSNPHLLAMGASEFESLTRLPAVPLELEAITEIVSPGQQFLNHEFTIETLNQELQSGQYSMVHLATHAEFQAGNAEASSIHFWQGEALTLRELNQIDWGDRPLDLLVLSACQTALGNPQAELGFAGLAFHAGVKTTIASLWFVSDLGSLALMKELYWQLTQPDITAKAIALQQAQQSMIHHHVHIRDRQLHTSAGELSLSNDLQNLRPDFSHPYYWAAFTLIGNPA